MLPVLKVTVLIHLNHKRQRRGEARHTCRPRGKSQTLPKMQVFGSNHVLPFIFSSPQLTTSASPLLASVLGPSPGSTCSGQLSMGQEASHRHERSYLGWWMLPPWQPPCSLLHGTQKCCQGQAAACEPLCLWVVWKISHFSPPLTEAQQLQGQMDFHVKRIRGKLLFLFSFEALVYHFLRISWDLANYTVKWETLFHS